MELHTVDILVEKQLQYGILELVKQKEVIEQ